MHQRSDHLSHSQIGFAEYWICRRISPETLDPAKAETVLFYMHGGACVIGHPFATSPELLLIGELLAAQGISCAIFSQEYPLVPNAPFPTQIDQAIPAYDWLVEELKFRPLQNLIAR